MKKLLNILSAVALVSLMQSCFFEQEDLFEDSAIERLEQKKTDAMNVLCSATNGWEMQYFVTGEQGHRGYPLLVKFFNEKGKEGVVHFAAKNELTGNKYVITDGKVGSGSENTESYFDIIFDNGPVLTFNTYNSVFHKYSDPNGHNNPGDQGLGVGLGGDYEFVIISAESDHVVLKGKKRGTYTILKKVPENLAWESYFNKLDSVNNLLYNNNPAPLRMVAGDASLLLYDGAAGIYSVVDSKDDDLIFAEQRKFIQTPTGIRFDVPFEFKGVTANQEFYFSSDNSRLESYIDNDPAKGVNAYIDAGDPYWFYNKTLNLNSDNKYLTEWVISEKDLGAKFAAKYNALKEAFDRDGRTGLKVFIGGLIGSGDAVQLQAKNVSRSRYWQQIVRAANDKDKVVDYKLGEKKSEYIDALVKAYPQVNELLSCFNGTFKFELTKNLNMSTLRVVINGDKEMSFNVDFVRK